MENTKNQLGSSSSSFAVDLFGPKDSSPSPSHAGHFGSIFGPSSTGLGKNSSHPGIMGQLRKHDVRYVNAKNKTPDYTSQRGNGVTDGTPRKGITSIYQNETVEPCYLSSSIYYGGQEVYSPNTQTSASQHIVSTFKKDGKDDDPNGSNSNSPSRGNWWEGSLYY